MKVGILHPENIRKGMHVVIVAAKRKFFGGEPPHDEFGPRFDGSPLKVIAYSYPFIAVWNGVGRFSVGVLEVELYEVNWRYAAAFLTSQTYLPARRIP